MERIGISLLFGSSVVETDTTITFLKSDLVGLAPSAVSSAEQVLVAILLRAKLKLANNRLVEGSANQVGIEFGYPSIAYRGALPQQQDTLIVTMQKTKVDTPISPSDY